ncbi:hypothetical protein BH18ACT11_BH18ACT11_02160 [soil metagenome]
MAETLPESTLDPKTPDKVEVTDAPREPVEDPTLGIRVEERARDRDVGAWCRRVASLS